MTQWTRKELANVQLSLAEFSQEAVAELIESVKEDPDKGQQLTIVLKELSEVPLGEQFLHSDFFPLACCVALSEGDFIGAIDVLFEVGSAGPSPALELATTYALQRLGVPALRRTMTLIDDAENPFERAFGYTVLQAVVDADQSTKDEVIDFCSTRARREGQAPEERKWECWPALAACETLVSLGYAEISPVIEWWMEQEDSEIPRDLWNELLIDVDGYRTGQKICEWRKPWQTRCRKLVEELRKHATYDNGTLTVRRESPKIGRNAPCPCGSGKKYKKCCLKL